MAAFYALGILYFAVYGRNQLILSPEEEFALEQGRESSRLIGLQALRRGALRNAARPDRLELVFKDEEIV